MGFPLLWGCWSARVLQRSLSCWESNLLQLQSPKSTFSPCILGRDAGPGRQPHQGGQSRCRVSGSPGEVCVVTFGLLLSVICGLHPGPHGGRGLRFPQGCGSPHPPAALPASVLGAGTQGSQLETLLCCSAMAEGGGPSDGEADTPPTCLREQPASGCRNGFFRTPAICSDAQGKKSFHDSLKSYSVLPPLAPGLLSATRGVTLPQEVLSPVNLVPNNSQIGRVTVLGPPPVRS